jgi:hypothetical protein
MGIIIHASRQHDLLLVFGGEQSTICRFGLGVVRLLCAAHMHLRRSHHS